MKHRCITIPKQEGVSIIGVCDDCEINDAEYHRGFGIYYHEVCGHCRLLEVMGRPLTK